MVEMRHSDLPGSLNDVTGDVVRAAVQVHKTFGPGLLESSYERCLAWELKQEGRHVDAQVVAPLQYRGLSIPRAYRMDLVVDGRVLVEVKSVEQLTSLHEAQVRTYLKMSGLPVALLINFNTPYVRDGIRRLIP